jgi:hypothetical protein
MNIHSTKTGKSYYLTFRFNKNNDIFLPVSLIVKLQKDFSEVRDLGKP